MMIVLINHVDISHVAKSVDFCFRDRNRSLFSKNALWS